MAASDTLLGRMSEPARRRIVLTILLLLGGGVFLTGIDWGLPSRAVDPYLFGDRPVWTGKQIQQLAGDRPHDTSRGADVDVNPTAGRDQPVWVNQTDAQRAEIIRRYRLYTHQPDEMITLMALASMNPGTGDLDPKLYQYGGLWIYPVGALLKIASTFGLIHVTADLTYYLDHPEAFGRFYVVARLYVVIWAMLGLLAVFHITRKITGGLVIPATAAACYVLMPVVVNMSHEAKPHLPGAVLTLLAVLAAMKYVETGRARWWALAGALCGGAFGMVLSALPAFALLPVMACLRRESWARRLRVIFAAGAIGAAVYLLSNPYVGINLVRNRQVLRSNLGNSAAMYQPGEPTAALANASRLIFLGAGAAAIVGAAGAVLLATSRSHSVNAAPLWLLLAPAGLILVQFVALAAGKPAEYARFAIVPDIALAIVAAVALGTLSWPRVRPWLCAGLIAITAWQGAAYVRAFVLDSSERNSRLLTAARLQQELRPGRSTLAVYFEPAPFSLPPVDLFLRKILLLPGDSHGDEKGVADFTVGPAGNIPGPRRVEDPAPISWANRPFEVRPHRTAEDRYYARDMVSFAPMHGVTTAIVAFIFVCIVYPHLVKNRPQFYAAFGCIVAVILLDSLAKVITNTGFVMFAYFMGGILQIVAIVMLFLAAGGLTLRQLTGDMARAYEVIRRGEEEKEIIIPIPGAKPKVKERPESPSGERINLTPQVPPEKKPPEDASLPLE